MPYPKKNKTFFKRKDNMESMKKNLLTFFVKKKLGSN